MPDSDNPIKDHLPEAIKPHPALQQSYLDAAVHAVIDPVVNKIAPTASAKAVEDEIGSYSKSFIKMAPLFMKGELAVGGLALAYVADQAKIGDSLSNQLTDAGLGLGKAVALKGSFAMMESRNLSPTMTGVGLGIVQRTSETALTRENYLDAKGHVSYADGLAKTMRTAFNPASVAVDAASFGAADVLWGRAYMRSRGDIRFDTILKNTLAGGTMGFTSGAGNELARQWQQGDGQYSLSAVLGRGLAGGALGTAAGRLGGMQSERSLRLDIKDAPGAINEARNTPFQRGEIVDANQAALRDGPITLTARYDHLMTPTYRASIDLGNNNWQNVLFRPNDGSEAFARRMQTELVGYGMGSKLKSANSVPVSVARSVEIDGRVVDGYVQEMRGKALLDDLHPGGAATFFRSPPKEMLAKVAADPNFISSYQEAWTQRLILGEWDNHSLNFLTDRSRLSAPEAPAINEPTEAGGFTHSDTFDRASDHQTVNVLNIDLGDALRPANSKADLIPRPGLRRGYENTSQYFYQIAASKPLSEQTVTNIREFVRQYDTPSGHQELQALGMTPQQTVGAMGRARWLAEQGRLPKHDAEPTAYSLAARIYKIVRGRSTVIDLSLRSIEQ
ncbi:MAG: hypothetical protein KGS72_13825 [Cyanobacteria bacterium REEB67]|nr:hypothetical protein [Cyanobacteria bacterium REEB67]